MGYSSNALYELIQERYRLLFGNEISTISSIRIIIAMTLTLFSYIIIW